MKLNIGRLLSAVVKAAKPIVVAVLVQAATDAAAKKLDPSARKRLPEAE